MTTTSTQDLQDILSAKKAEIAALPGVIEADIVTGEIVTQTATDGARNGGPIVPVTAVEGSPTVPPAVPAPIEVRYPEIPPKVVGGLPYVRDYMKLAKTICNTEFVPAAYRGRPDVICAAFMAGHELGMGPMQSINSFDPIQGRVALKSEAMRALIEAAGHLFIPTEGDGYAEIICRRRDWPERIADVVYRWDMNNARDAGLAGKDNWKKYQRDMLMARATSGAARRYFADVLAGMSYTPEEIRDFSGPDQEVTPSPSTTPPPVPTAPSTTKASEPSMSNSPQAGPESASVPEPASPPKRPRGRPRKAQSAPKDAPGRSAPPTTPQAPPAPALLVVDTPELTSLNSPGEIGVTREMLKSLTEIIKSLPQAQQPLCWSFIRQHFPEGTADLTPADVQKCIDIAAGWPDSMAQHPAPEPDDAF